MRIVWTVSKNFIEKVKGFKYQAYQPYEQYDWSFVGQVFIPEFLVSNNKVERCVFELRHRRDRIEKLVKVVIYVDLLIIKILRVAPLE